jgi:hypothetical protein
MYPITFAFMDPTYFIHNPLSSLTGVACHRPRRPRLFFPYSFTRGYLKLFSENVLRFFRGWVAGSMTEKEIIRERAWPQANTPVDK